MNTERVIQGKRKIHLTSIASTAVAGSTLTPTVDCLNAGNIPQFVRAPGDDSATKKVSGRVLMSQGEEEQPVAQARVELYQSASPQAVAGELSEDVLANIRYFLLEGFRPIGLYSYKSHIADAPLVDFEHIEQLRNVPGFELVVAAARFQSDSSFAQLLRNNPIILQALLCYYHPNHLPALCAATTITDTAGFFHFEIDEQGYSHTRPGYYFVVRRFISSNLFITLYNPMPAAWYTHWELPAETITLRTRHPLAVGVRD